MLQSLLRLCTAWYEMTSTARRALIAAAAVLATAAGTAICLAGITSRTASSTPKAS